MAIVWAAALVAALVGVALVLASRRRAPFRRRPGRLDVAARGPGAPRRPAPPPSTLAPEPDPESQVDFQAAVWEATRQVDQAYRGAAPGSGPPAAGVSPAEDAAQLEHFASDLRQATPARSPSSDPELPRRTAADPEGDDLAALLSQTPVDLAHPGIDPAPAAEAAAERAPEAPPSRPPEAVAHPGPPLEQRTPKADPASRRPPALARPSQRPTVGRRRSPEQIRSFLRSYRTGRDRGHEESGAPAEGGG